MAMGPAGRVAVVGFPRPRHGDLPVEILESKLYKPTIRPGVVPRPRLLARLRAARTVPTVAVVAPAGYGKTTLLALWAQDDDRPFAWLSVDPHDNDPIVLLTHLAVALDRISPLPTEVFDALGSAGVSVPATVVPRLGSALSHLPHPVVIVLDDVHHLRDGASLDALVTLVGHVPGTTQIALAGRGMPVPLARQRVDVPKARGPREAMPSPTRGSCACWRRDPLDPAPRGPRRSEPGDTRCRAAQQDRPGPNQPDRLMCLRRPSPTLR
jgi:LuxR family maltose regulon positive regulatory protein